MNKFYEGLISGVAMLGGLCAFIYWVFNLLEKRLELKIDLLEGKFEGKFNHLDQKIDGISARLDKAISEQADQRKRTDQLYEILINMISDQKNTRTNP